MRLDSFGVAGAGLAGAIRPGVLCTIAALGAGFAMDVLICLPAEELYNRKVRFQASISQFGVQYKSSCTEVH